MEGVKDFWEELKRRWDDPYFWADHQLEATVIMCVLIAILDIGKEYVKLKMRVQMLGGNPNV